MPRGRSGERWISRGPRCCGPMSASHRTGEIRTLAGPGVFIALPDGEGEGLLPLSGLPPRARLDERRQTLHLGKRRLQLGDPVEVRIAHVDLAAGRTRLALVGPGDARRDQASASRTSTSAARRSHSR